MNESQLLAIMAAIIYTTNVGEQGANHATTSAVTRARNILRELQKQQDVAARWAEAKPHAERSRNSKGEFVVTL